MTMQVPHTRVAPKPPTAAAVVAPDLSVQVPAIAGRMGSTDYYLCTFPVGLAAHLFLHDPSHATDLPVAQRVQRKLNARRVPEIASYILENDDWFFSSIVVSVDAAALTFTGGAQGVGTLAVPAGAQWLVNDGQHRMAGLTAALRTAEELGKDTIAVLVLPDQGLERAQQVFSDLNRTAQKTSASLNALFDHRSPINRITGIVADSVAVFAGRVDKEREALTARSDNFTTLAALQAANTALLGELTFGLDDELFEQAAAFAVGFWEVAQGAVEPWARIAAGAIGPAEARKDWLSSYTIVLGAIAALGRELAWGVGGDWAGAMNRLREVDWTKSNPDWQGVCMEGDTVVTRGPTRRALLAVLRHKVGISGEDPVNAAPGEV